MSLWWKDEPVPGGGSRPRRRVAWTAGIGLLVIAAGSWMPGRPALAGTEGKPAEEPAPAVADEIDGRVRDLLDRLDYARAGALARKLVAEAEAAHGPASLQLANALDTLFAALWHGAPGAPGAGWQETLDVAERALAIKESVLGPQDPEIAESLRQVALVRGNNGRWSEVVPLLERAVGILAAAFGPEDARVGRYLRSLGTAAWRSGDLARGRSLIERSVLLLENEYGLESLRAADSRWFLAGFLLEIGDYAGARSEYERALAIEEKALAADHPNYGRSLLGYGNFLAQTGDLHAAEAMFRRGLAIVQEPDQDTLTAFGTLLLLTGRDAEARSCYERAVEVAGQDGMDHYYDAGPLLHRANMRRIAGAFEAARADYERALVILETVAPESPSARGVWLDLDAPRIGLATLLLETGEPSRALDLALAAEEVERQSLRLASGGLAERQALRYAAVRNAGLDLALFAAAGSVTPAANARLWDATVRSRAVVLDEIAARHRTAAGSADPALADLTREFAAARRELAEALVRGGAEGRLDALRARKEAAERALAERSRAFRRERAREAIGGARVGAALPPDGAVVAFVRYGTEPRTGGFSAQGPPLLPTLAGSADSRQPSYLAFVVRAGEPAPEVVTLGAAAEVESLVSRWRREAAAGTAAGDSAEAAGAAYRAAGEALRRAVWDPVAARLDGVRSVFVVPDGALRLVSLAALPVGPSSYVLETGPTIHYVSAERDVVPADDAPAGEGLLVVGDPSFDDPAPIAALRPAGAGSSGDVESLRDPREAVGSPHVQVAAPRAYRGRRSACGDFGSISFGRLPDSGAEADEVSALWTTTPQGGPEKHASAVRRLTGSGATEAAFKAEAPGKRVLHLATHGFFLGGVCASALDEARGVGATAKMAAGLPPAAGAAAVGAASAVPPATSAVTRPPSPGTLAGSGATSAPAWLAGENPLLLSGLALAGANHREAAGPEEEDGILTAEEIAALDLSGVEWAVLSACDTGVGEIQAGEGVFGLRRAFQVAGARTLIMSLWSVEDESAREWMRALYEARLEAGMSTAEAVRHASLAVLRARRARGESDHPFYWAGFVAAGDWR
jgi:tetratricopeptide (TPR) repeat protein